MWWSDYYVLLFSLALVAVVDGCGRDDSRENTPPSISCPSISDVTAQAGHTWADVTWSLPSVNDNNGGWTLTLQSGSPSGSRFGQGTHTVVYRVVDAGGLSDTCSVSFTVTVIRCPLPSRPDNGQMHCDSSIYGSTCNFSCDSGYTLDGRASKTCQSNGQFQYSVPTCTN